MMAVSHIREINSLPLMPVVTLGKKEAIYETLEEVDSLSMTSVKFLQKETTQTVYMMHKLGS